MSTRLKRPAIFRHFFIGALLISFQVYLGYGALSGRFGIESQKQMIIDIAQLEEKSAELQAQIKTYQQRISLFSPDRLDPDIISEKAREVLSMASPDDIIVVLPAGV